MRCQTCPPFSPPPRFPTRTPLRHTNDTIEAVPRPSRRRFAPARGRAPCTVPCPILRRIVFAFSSGRLSKVSTSRNQSRQAVAAAAPALAAYRAIQPPANNGKYARDRLQKNAAHQNYRPVPTRLAERSARHSALRTGRTAFVHFPPRYASAPAQLPRLTVRTKGVRMKRIRKKPSAIHSQTAFS